MCCHSSAVNGLVALWDSIYDYVYLVLLQTLILFLKGDLLVASNQSWTVGNGCSFSLKIDKQVKRFDVLKQYVTKCYTTESTGEFYSCRLPVSYN
jgi:hypothetical protein